VSRQGRSWYGTGQADPETGNVMLSKQLAYGYFFRVETDIVGVFESNNGKYPICVGVNPKLYEECMHAVQADVVEMILTGHQVCTFFVQVTGLLVKPELIEFAKFHGNYLVKYTNLRSLQLHLSYNICNFLFTISYNFFTLDESLRGFENRAETGVSPGLVQGH
jgi:hypothetical protein